MEHISTYYIYLQKYHIIIYYVYKHTVCKDMYKMNRMNIMTSVYLKECLEFSGTFDRQDLRQLNTLFLPAMENIAKLR